MNIMMLLEMAAATFPDRTAFVDGNNGERLSYQALFDNAGLHAKQISASGYSRVGMLDVSSLATPTGLFAAAWAGAPYVPINYRLTQGEIEALLARITPACVVTDDQRANQFDHVADVTTVGRTQFLAQAVSPNDTSEQAEAAQEWSMDPEETAVLLFTSGTTGAPKAAVLRQKHLVRA